MQDNFRLVLRSETRDDHEHVDRLFSALDISRRAHFAAFARVHHACFGAMQRNAGKGSATRDILDQLVLSLQFDLSMLGRPATEAPAHHLRPVDPLALDYVVEGSRLGSKILRNRWAASKDPAVRAANAYFNVPADTKRWQAVCRALEKVPPNTARAKAVIMDTKEIFGLFAAAHHDLATAVNEEPLTK